MEKLNLILVPTDFSANSCEVFSIASFLGQKLGSKILVLHVIPERDAEAMISVPGQPWEWVMEQEDKNLIDHFLSCFNSDFAKVPRPETAVVAGVAHEEIIKTAEKRGAGMIIMATHGRTGLSHALMGSIAEKVIRSSPCPVLTIKPKNLSSGLGGIRGT